MSGWLEVTEFKVRFDRFPPETVRLALCDWMKRHSVDPMDVCVPGWVFRSPEQRRVYWQALELGPDGKPIQVGDYELKQITQYAQLESPPAPWPAVVALHIEAA